MLNHFPNARQIHRNRIIPPLENEADQGLPVT